MHLKSTLLLAALLVLGLPGCFAPFSAIDDRSAMEQELTRVAITRAVASLEIPEELLEGTWRIQVVAPEPHTGDGMWVREMLRARLATIGVKIANRFDDSLPVLVVLVTFAGADNETISYGVSLPTVGRDFGLFQMNTSRGRAQIGLALWAADGSLIRISPKAQGGTFYRTTYLLTFIGPISSSDVEDIYYFRLGEDVDATVDKLQGEHPSDEY